MIRGSAMALLALMVLVVGNLAPLLPSYSQESSEIPPLPRPRPDRDAGATSGAGTAATDAIDTATSAPQPVTLKARITHEGDPVTDGLVWRVFEATPDASGEVALVAKSEDGTGKFQLPPGPYMVHVAYGRAQVSQELNVVPGPNDVTIDLEAGALRLNSMVTGDIPISPTELHFDIMTAGSESSRQMVAENLAPNEIVTLTAGTYHIISRFGDVNASVKADLRVEPGEITDATLYQRASELSFKLVSEEGGEAIADVEWTVKTDDGTTIFTDRGAFPTTVLAEGDYLVLAKLGDRVYNREIQVQPGSPREVEVLTTVY
ncbi:hypothetical protein IC608_02720 [Devosia sp. PTR5]|uniref:Uncharacterized protein n=1 Tax=Devosia oryzisoli TaxID=2774138 RepID=A0A927FTH4_9HYPH|nr:hypothetical protein [Devosia oryzisoli]MBD8064389.1 hypothetical protein [Devosia oryzisoli]